jgi:hypothetical protein
MKMHYYKKFKVVISVFFVFSHNHALLYFDSKKEKKLFPKFQKRFFVQKNLGFTQNHINEVFN